MTIALQRFVEEPVWFGAGDEELFGVLVNSCDADAPKLDLVVVLMHGGGPAPSTHRNRMYVRLARQLASGRVASLRFDLHGKGDSTGLVDEYRLDRPFPSDVLGAVSFLEQRGFSQVVLVGTCFGARSILAASSHIGNLAGVALIATPVRDADTREERGNTTVDAHTRKQRGATRTFAGRMGHRLPETAKRSLRVALRQTRRLGTSLRVTLRRAEPELDRVSPDYLEPLAQLASRVVPLLIMHGTDDEYYQDFTAGRAGQLGRVLEQAEPHLRVVMAEGKLHGYSTVAGQDLIVATVHEWVMSLPARDPTG